MTRLPRSTDDLRGLRAARWLRESTAGQKDRWGPEEQRVQQDEAIARWGLADTGIGWLVAHSGYRKDRHGDVAIASTGQWAEMLAWAGDRYDVLVMGYVSRHVRDLRAAVNARHDLHRAGAALLFADEGILSSDEDQWEHWARESVEAEAYSRRLGKHIRNGYAAKRRAEGVPGGNRPPFGLLRIGPRPWRLMPDPDRFPTLLRAYELSASGLTDRQVAAATGLKLTHVHEVLTNPVYAGRLHRGEPVPGGPFVDPALWDRVQVLRSASSRRHPGTASRRRYALSGVLSCGPCGRRLTGHGGRYRHVEACAPFVAARPRLRRGWSNASDRRVRGESYVAEAYEDPIRELLGMVALSARVMAGVLEERDPAPDPFTLARIGRDRESATTRYLRDRDTTALERTMAMLDAQERAALERPTAAVTTAQARAYLEDLPRLWDDTDDEGRAAIARGAFAKLAAWGVEDVEVTLTPEAEAHGFALAFADGPIRCSIGRYGRGERASADGSDVTYRLAAHQAPVPLRAARSA